MALGPRFPFAEPQKHRVPAEWQHVVCCCFDENGTKHDLDKFGHFMLCRKCGLLKRFYTSHCSLCKEFYLMVFKHPAWNPHLNWCWTCLESKCIREGIVYSTTPPPEWAQSKAPPTKEEVAEALDDFFTTVVELENSVDFDF